MAQPKPSYSKASVQKYSKVSVGKMSLSKSTFGYGARFSQNNENKRSVSKLILEKIDSKRQMELENQIESHVNFYKRVNQVFEKY